MRSPRRWGLAITATVALTAVVLLPILEARAQQTFVVNTTADPLSGSCAGGTGSLRQCLAAAASVAGSLVTFSVNGVFTLIGGELTINSQLTIQGNGAANTIIDGFQSDGVMTVGTRGRATVSGVTVRNGRRTRIQSAQGGGIFNAGTLVLTDSAVTGNTVVGTPITLNGQDQAFADGGGIYSLGSLTLTGVTISGNTVIAQDPAPNATVGADGGGLYTLTGTAGGLGPLVMTNTTVSGNQLVTSATAVAARGGGVFDAYLGNFPERVDTATNVTITGNTGAVNGSGMFDNNGIVIANSIIAGNTPAKECIPGQNPSSTGYNLDDDSSCFFAATDLHTNPKLGPLADNGGPTMTHALLAGSPAIDAVGAACPPPATDQRGVTRPQGPACDIGAFEVVESGPPPTTTTTTSIPVTTTTTSIPATTTTTAATTTTTIPATTTTTAAPTITCFVTGLLAGPPKQQQVTVQSSAGLASIHSVNITNGTVSVAPFTVGTTGPVVVTATKANQSQSTSWNFVATDVNGFSQYCG